MEFREAFRHGLSVFLSIHHLNGEESFSLSTILGPNLAGRPPEDADNRTVAQVLLNQLLLRQQKKSQFMNPLDSLVLLVDF